MFSLDGQTPERDQELWLIMPGTYIAPAPRGMMQKARKRPANAARGAQRCLPASVAPAPVQRLAGPGPGTRHRRRPAGQQVPGRHRAAGRLSSIAGAFTVMSRSRAAEGSLRYRAEGRSPRSAGTERLIARGRESGGGCWWRPSCGPRRANGWDTFPALEVCPSEGVGGRGRCAFHCWSTRTESRRQRTRGFVVA